MLKEVQPLLEKQENYSNDALFELLGQYAKDKEKKVGFCYVADPCGFIRQADDTWWCN